MKLFFFTCLAAVFPAFLFAQCETEEYRIIMEYVERDVAQQAYQLALSRLLDLRDICPEEKAVIDQLIFEAFSQLEAQKQALESSRQTLADSLLTVTQSYEAIAQSNLALKREKVHADSNMLAMEEVLDQLYFYEGKFGLARMNIGIESRKQYRYGYIDPQGRELIPFRFYEAAPFSKYTGLAKVYNLNESHLLDTLGNMYLIKDIFFPRKTVQALDLSSGIKNRIPILVGMDTSLRIIIGQGYNSVYFRRDIKNLRRFPKRLCKLSSLKFLSLRHNAVKQLPDRIGELNQLEHLDLTRNKLTALPASFAQLQQLQYLNLSGNYFQQFPESIFALSQLTHLHLSGSYFRSLSPQISNLSRLKQLGLSSTNLTSLPEEICQLSLLQKLDLQYCGLKTLPENIGQLQQLTELNLADNELEKLPESFFQLTHLKTLNLSGNKLEGEIHYYRRRLPNCQIVFEY